MVEIEIKLRINKTADVESRLRLLGAFLENERSLEDDLLYDFPDRRLTGAGQLLRLRRRPDGALVTFKEAMEADPGAKVRREIETHLADFDVMAGILQGLGMAPIWRYQKYRTTYQLGGLHALVDELPIGNFLELEGPRKEIDQWAGALGFRAGDYLVDTYRDLYEAWIAERGLPAGDMIFTGEGP